MNQTAAPLQFKTIDLNLHTDICIEFRIDSFVASFGSPDRFYSDGTPEQYLESLRAKIKKDPRTIVHVWLNEEIIGQMELGVRRDDPTMGYVNLFYLRADKRGSGFSKYLDQYAADYFKSIGLTSAMLSVSPTNHRAWAYYQKMNWVDLGPRPQHPEVHYMKKNY